MYGKKHPCFKFQPTILVCSTPPEIDKNKDSLLYCFYLCNPQPNNNLPQVEVEIKNFEHQIEYNPNPTDHPPTKALL